MIGVPLPIDKLLGGLGAAAAGLSPDGGAAAAGAILTTDTCPKQAVAHGDGFTVGGMAKGSGMIHPNLATMLAVLTTDYPLEPGEALGFLRRRSSESFNAISVDGECSTNDAVVLLANGASAPRGTTPPSPTRCTRSAPTSPSRSSPTARARPCSPRSRSPAPRGTRGAGDRPAHRDLATRQDRALRTRRELGPRVAAAGRRRSTAASRNSTPIGGDAPLQRHEVLGRAPRGAEPDLAGAACRSSSTSASAPARRYLTSDLSYDYIRINAEYRT